MKLDITILSFGYACALVCFLFGMNIFVAVCAVFIAMFLFLLLISMINTELK